MKKVCFLVDSIFSIGGVQRVTAVIAKELAKDCDVTIVTLDKPDQQDTSLYDLKEANIHYRFFSYPTISPLRQLLCKAYSGFYRRCQPKGKWFSDRYAHSSFPAPLRKPLATELQQGHYDAIIGVHAPLAVRLATIRQQLKGTRCIGWIHNSFEALFGPTSLYIGPDRQRHYIYQFRKLDETIVLCHHDAAVYRAYDQHFQPTVVYNPLTLQPGKLSEGTSKRFLAVGRFSRLHKGFDLLIDAFHLFAQKNKDWTLHIVGEGPEEELYRKKIADYDLGQRVIIHPFSNHIQDYYSEAQVYVLSSRWEGFGLVLVEAMAHGLPVVSSDLPTSLEIMGSFGLYFHNGNTEELAEKLEEASRLNASEKAKEATAIARRFSIDRIMEQWRRILFAFIGLMCCISVAEAKVKFKGQKAFVYRYYLKDKKGGNVSLDRPAHFLSQKSLARRKRQGLKVDSTDLPIPDVQLREFRVKDATVIGTSRWNNTVVVSARDTALLNQLAQLPIVREARMVYQYPDSVDNNYEPFRPKHHDYFNRWDSLHNDPLGMARQQMEMIGGDRLHELDLRGQGMTIAVLDGGFQNVDQLPCFFGTKIVGIKDFVTPHRDDHFYDGIDHGTKVLSALAADAPEVMMGTAPEAGYWLLRCEDPVTEMPIEEDYWAMAAEFADSVGVDIINSSLGYQEYDNGLGEYRLQDLDGEQTLISHTASMLARKGIVLCNSAGNSGMGSWKKITVPADANDILTVGAVDHRQKNASFASVGPTQDGRVKPDVVAQGVGTTLISGRGTLIRDMGTSFSTPIVCGLVACLWQGLPGKTALEIIELVRQSASQYDTPDNIYGYGLPDFWQAYMIGKMGTAKEI